MASFMQFSLLICLPIIVLGLVVPAKSEMDTIHEWKYLDYYWPMPEDREEAIRSGRYIAENAILMDVDRSPNGDTFVTVKGRNGVPATLATVSKRRTGPGGPLLEPYPDWSWFKEDDCRSMFNVHKIAIDKCNRLWVLDSGSLEGQQYCSPKLLAFNLERRAKVFEQSFSRDAFQNFTTHKGLLITPLVHTIGDACQMTKIFMSEVEGHGLLVVQVNSHAYRLESEYFVPDLSQNLVRSQIGWESFHLDNTFFSMAITQQNPQYLVFKPYASNNMYATRLNDLKPRSPVNCRRLNNVSPLHTTVQAFSSEGILFFGLVQETAIGCWHWYSTRDPLKSKDIVAQDYKTLQITSGLKVVPPSQNQPEEELWVSTNRYHKALLRTMDFSQVNFRVLKQSVTKLISGTNCESNSRRGF